MFCNRIGHLNVIVPCAYLSGVCVLAWTSVQTFGSLIATSFLYSLISGGLMALPPAVLVALSPDLRQIGVRVGMALTVGSLGVLIGPPIAGAILARQNVGSEAHDYKGVLVFTGVALLVCGAFMSATRVIKKGLTLAKI